MTTPDETITARELDRLCATEVLRWTRQRVIGSESGSAARRGRGQRQIETWVDPAGAFHHDVPYLSATLTAAERVQRALSAEGYLWRLVESVTGWTATVTLPDADWSAHAPTLAQAICVAACKARGLEIVDVTSLPAAA